MTDSIQKNLNMAIYITTGANFLASAVFFILYVFLHSLWYLVAAIIVFLAGIFFVFIIRSLQRRISKKINE